MIKKFSAPSIKEAIQLAKEHFGPDAVILQTKNSDDDSGLVELIAMSEDGTPRLSQKPAAKKETKSFYTVSDLRSPPKSNSDKSDAEIMAELSKLKEKVLDISDYIRYSKMLMMPETLHFLKDEKGVEENIAAELIQKISQKLNESQVKDQLKVRQTLQAEISNYVTTYDSTVLPRNKPKLICLVGPTGVGKTTSIIKLATNPDFFGKHKVALITIDTYRVAAAAQLKTFAALAQLPLEIVYEPSEFRQAVERFGDQHVILVDTAGRSPLDADHLAELKRYLALELFDEIHLVLSVSMHPDILADSARSFSALPVNRLMISKIDETKRLGNILNVGKRVELPISFLTNGQRVPDDIHLADKNEIARMIVN
ncbi:MAG: flagellar biosynthesis protein FlhF [bacterium]